MEAAETDAAAHVGHPHGSAVGFNVSQLMAAAGHHQTPHPQQQPFLSMPAATSSSSFAPFAPSPAPQAQATAAAACPWTRMKWTDRMVRLLISVVNAVGDDAAAGGEDHPGGGGSGKQIAGGAGGREAAQQQRKGKWKSVSKAMVERGFAVSPQQCEDKFNDLNKRYKRVVELLGRGTACRVVETPALLETMDLKPKAREEARKLLASKHLFFPEMCRYHNPNGTVGCPGAGAAVAGAGGGVAAPMPIMPAEQFMFAQDNGGGSESEEYSSDESDEDYGSEDGSDADGGDSFGEDEDISNGGCKHGNGHRQGLKRGAPANLGHSHGEGAFGKRLMRTPTPASAASSSQDFVAMVGAGAALSLRQLRGELAAAAALGEREAVRQLVRRRAAEVEEQRVACERTAIQLERRKLKWMRFSAKKEAEMERARLRNERARLDSDRMRLLLRRAELEIAAGTGGTAADQHTPPRF